MSIIKLQKWETTNVRSNQSSSAPKIYRTGSRSRTKDSANYGCINKLTSNSKPIRFLRPLHGARTNFRSTTSAEHIAPTWFQLKPYLLPETISSALNRALPLHLYRTSQADSANTENSWVFSKHFMFSHHPPLATTLSTLSLDRCNPVKKWFVLTRKGRLRCGSTKIYPSMSLVYLPSRSVNPLKITASPNVGPKNALPNL